MKIQRIGTLTVFTAFVLGAALLIVIAFTGCANSNADRDFRSKVKSVEVTGTGGADQRGNVTAGAGAKFEFRDPSK